MKTVLLALVCSLAAILAAPAWAEEAAKAGPSPAGGSDRLVVLISLDGLAAFYFDDPKAEMPTIRAIAAEGARARGMKASTPTVTWPNHATLMTGVHPAKHGVVGNNYFDRATGQRVALIGDPAFDQAQLVKVPTIFDGAKAAGLKTAAVRWPATRNAKSIDWILPDSSSFELFDKYTTSALVADARTAGLMSEFDDARKKDPNARYLPTDERCTKLFKLILEKRRPNLAALHLIDVDHVQHLSGPRSPEAYAAIKTTDGRVREVWDTMKTAFLGKATLVIASDHGFSPIERIVLPNVVLRKAKLLNDGNTDDATRDKPSNKPGNKTDGADAKTDDKPDGKTDEKTDGNADDQTDATTPSVRVVVQGGCSMIYILNDNKRDEIVQQVTKAFEGLEGVAKVVPPDGMKAYGVADPKDDPHAPDMLLFAKLGYSFGDTAAGDRPFNEKPERKGSHGHDPNLPELHASFFAWGAGIKPGVEIGEIANVAVAPTIAELLKFPMKNLDGKPLAEILAD